MGACGRAGKVLRELFEDGQGTHWIEVEDVGGLLAHWLWLAVHLSSDGARVLRPERRLHVR